LAVYFLLFIFGYKLRKPRSLIQKDRFCLNIWLDETCLEWKKSDQNIYSAHEIAQIKPLLNKNNTYERFLFVNKWILNYWPKSVKINEMDVKTISKPGLILNVFEIAAFKLQYLYMKHKITKETVTSHKAIFHPVNQSIKIFS
jgi:hypothetical protein